MSRIGGAAVASHSLQEALEADTAREEERAVDGLDRGSGWKSCLKQRLGFTGIPCWAPVLGLMTSSAVSVGDTVESQPPENGPRVPAGAGMNLAAALAAERAICQRRGGRSPSPAPETPTRVSLMGLLEGTDGGDGSAEEEVRGGIGRIDSVCCVCMGRKKDAAFVPCGHTFCRQCSKELRASRGTCPVCNRWILQILDLF